VPKIVQQPSKSPDSGAARIAHARAFLGANGWLSRVPADFRAAVLARTLIRSVQPGHRVATAGDEIGGLIGLVEGCLAQSSPQRLEAAFIHLLHPGDWTGQVPLITGGPRALSTEARLPSTYALVPLAEMQRIMAQFPHCWRDVAKLATEGALVAISASTELMIPDSERRTAGALLRVAGYMPEIRPTVQIADIPATQDEIAVIAGVSRNTMAKILASFVKRGLIEMTYRRVRLLEPEALRLVARGI
jgi:CRP-like cAMP-binding protein